MTENELEISKKVIIPLARRIKSNKVTSKLAFVLNCNLDLDPSSQFLNLGDGIRTTKYDYLYNELQWYLSEDCCINGHKGIESNKIWQLISTADGHINSNYGYLVFSKGNYNQYAHAVSQFYKDKYTKHAVMIYNRPEIVIQWNDHIHAESDFICTYATSFMTNEHDELHMMVNMRSNDLTTGFFNDFGWQVFIYKKFFAEVVKRWPTLKQGKIHWHTDNMHVYARDYELVLKLYEYYRSKK
jgi:thymidylate synthase